MKTIRCLDAEGNEYEVPLESFKREYVTCLGLQDDFKESDEFVSSLCTDNVDPFGKQGVAMFSYARNRDYCFVIDIMQNFKGPKAKLRTSLVKSFNQNQSFYGAGMDMLHELESYEEKLLPALLQGHKKSALNAYRKLKEIVK